MGGNYMQEYVSFEIIWRRLLANDRGAAWPQILGPGEDTGHLTEVKQVSPISSFLLTVGGSSVIAQTCPKKDHHEILQRKAPSQAEILQ